jgi:lipoprotein-releasing system permease protein
MLQHDKGRDGFSRPLVGIATYTIALGVLVMLMAVCILRGFQREIRGKVVGFGSHITVRSYGWVNDYDEIPLIISDDEVAAMAATRGVAHLQPYAYKGGMIKTDDQIQGIIFKGLGAGFDSTFFAKHLLRGRLFRTDSTARNEIIISQSLASKLLIDTGDKARTYFWTGNNYRARAFTIVGIYNTDLSEFDDHYIVGNIAQIQALNGWNNGEVAGYEITLDDFDNLDDALLNIKGVTRPDLAVTSIREEQPSMFAWLDLLNSNIILILTIMAFVCAASVISALLIMIFEKTSMIGILKTLGASDRSIRRIFLLKSAAIIAKGILIGDALALILCLLQSNLHIVKLDTASYSMSYVPIETDPLFFILISIATALLCLLALLLPSTYISHIQPAKTIRVE